MRKIVIMIVLLSLVVSTAWAANDWPRWRAKVIQNIEATSPYTNDFVFLSRLMEVFVAWIYFESGGLREMTWDEADGMGLTWADLERTRTLPLTWRDTEKDP